MKRILIITFLSLNFINAQTLKERKKIVQNYDINKFEETRQYLKSEFEATQNRIQNYLESLTIEERSKVDLQSLKDVTEDGFPIIVAPDNSASATTIRVNHLHTGGSLGLDLNGQGMVAGVWEASNGYPLQTHLDLAGKISVIDGGTNVNFHATHVTGTIISSGDNISLNLGRGLAYEATVLAANSSNDNSEMNTQAASGLLVSNHSYGLVANSLPTWFFGAYTSDAFNIDLITSVNPYYLPVISAGNDRDNFTTYNPTKGGYDLLTGQSVSKNGITSAAVNQVLNYTDASDVVMSNFSNWGGTDDGRIKPDISSKGVGVLSTSNSSNTAYANSNGTSMSAPAISALLLLMQQHYNNVNSSFMLSATAKGLLLHTADEAGNAKGPDYSFGWGLANGLKAVETISNNGTTSFIEEASLSNSNSNTFDIVASGTEPLMISICWTDPQGSTATSGVVDDTTPRLVNDLDIKLTRNSTDFFPWKMDINSPNSTATRNSTNDVDNFEKVEIDNPGVNDIYTVTINHKGSLQGGSQNYSIIITGGIPTSLSTNEEALYNGLNLYPNPSNNIINIKANLSDLKSEITIIDINGRTIYKENINSSSNLFSHQIDVSKFNSGVYFLNLKNGASVLNSKFIKN